MQHTYASGATGQAPDERRAVERRLVAVNVALLAVLAGLVLISLPSPSIGQSGVGGGVGGGGGGGERPRGDYAVISGRTQGATTSTLYVLDAANQQLAALQWNRTSNRLEPIGFRSLADDGRRQSPPR